MRTYEFTFLIACCFASLCAYATALSSDAVSVYVAYNLPSGYLPVEDIRISATNNPWDRIRKIEIAINNHLDHALTATLSKLTVAEMNRTFAPHITGDIPSFLNSPVPAIKADKEVALPSLSIAAGVIASVEIDPAQDFQYNLRPGRPYLIYMTWYLTDGKSEQEIIRVIPYTLPDPNPTFTSNSVTQNGLSARIRLQNFFQASLELQNLTEQTVTLTAVPAVNAKVHQTKLQIDPLKTTSAGPEPITIPPSATIILPLSDSQLDNNNIPYGFHLSFPSVDYVLNSGQAYQVDIILTANDKNSKVKWRWEIPTLHLVVPLKHPWPVIWSNPKAAVK